MKTNEQSGLDLGRNKRIRVMVADDHPIVRSGLRTLITAEADMELIGEAGDGLAAMELIREKKPDVLVLDLRMPAMDGLATLEALKNAGESTRVLVLTGSEDKEEYIQAMKLGCSGIILKRTNPDLIVKSIRKVHQGEIWLDSHTTAAVMRQFASPHAGAQANAENRARGRAPLSQRERQIVTLVAQGYKNKEMAEKLYISEQTVKNHLHNVFDKLGVSDRLELALYAIHHGIHSAEIRENGRSGC